MSWLGLGLGEFGSQLGQASMLADEAKQRRAQLAIEQARQKMEESLVPLRMIEVEEARQRLAQSKLPRTVGTFSQDGNLYGIVEDPMTGKTSTQLLLKSTSRYPEFKSLQEAQGWAISHGDQPLLDQVTAQIKSQQREPQVPASTQEYLDWQDAFKKKFGRDPNAAEIENWHHQPRADVQEATPPIVAAYADDLHERRITIDKIPAKARGAVVDYMQKHNMILPPQLPAGTLDKLTQRETALDNTIQILQDIKQDADLLKDVPTASLISLSQSVDGGRALLSRFGGLFTSKEKLARIDRLSGNLRSMQEHINVMRSPLGATGFRGAEGWAALQAQAVSALARPGVNAQVIENSLRVLTNLRDRTQELIYGLPPSNSSAGPNTGATPPGVTIRDYTKKKPKGSTP